MADRRNRLLAPHLARGLYAALALAALLLAACSGDPGTGPVEVKWDRDVCTRCGMVLSDRLHAAQVRHTAATGRSTVHLFDDIGCAVLWLDQQPWKDDQGVEIWVTDHRDGRWIDARSAFYVAGRVTPMQYGLGAQADPATGTLDYAGARAHIHQVEQTVNVHGGNLGDHAAPALPSIETAAPTPESR